MALGYIASPHPIYLFSSIQNTQLATHRDGHAFSTFPYAHRRDSSTMKSLILSSFVYGFTVASTFDFRSLSARQTAIKTVNTTSGLVSGHASSNTSANVAEYLGIPYAQPPVGDLRFAPPLPYNGTSGINGTNFVGNPWLQK
jgi:Carboxylesterase family